MLGWRTFLLYLTVAFYLRARVSRRPDLGTSRNSEKRAATLCLRNSALEGFLASALPPEASDKTSSRVLAIQDTACNESVIKHVQV